MIKSLLDNEKQLLFSTEKQASTLPNVTRVISPSWYNLTRILGWEIHSEFCVILQLFQFWTFWTPEFSLEFYFSNRKMFSHQFWTRFLWFGILSCHWFFRFHESKNVPAFFFWDGGNRRWVDVGVAGQALSRCGQALSRCRCGGTGVE